MHYSLPTSVGVCGRDYAIRSDFRAALDIFAALSDPELDGFDRAEALLDIFYPDYEAMPPEHYREAVDACFRFLRGGAEESAGDRGPRLVDWEQDFPYIVAPVNRVVGRDIRGMEFLHWWTFLSAYLEIGECLFAQIVSIRSKRASGKPLSKEERQWYRKNRALVDFKANYTEAENDLLKHWTGK